jgi:uncharacterized membrane protein YcaP (DUF421 family)
MISDDKSLSGGLVSAATLIGLAQAMNYASWRSKRVARVIEGTPKTLARHGRCIREVMHQELVTTSELTEAMRSNGCASIADIRVAILENNGQISIIKREAQGSEDFDLKTLVEPVVGAAQ